SLRWRKANRDAAAMPENLPRRSRRIRAAACGPPLLAGALPVTFRLVRIHFAHFFEQILRIWARNVRGTRSITVTRLRSPWHRFGGLLNTFWHWQNLRAKSRLRNRGSIHLAQCSALASLSR